jgi:amino acid transporter
MQPRRTIGLVGITAASVGSMIGSSWLFAPLYAAQMAGPAAIISWLLAGFFFIFIVLVFAELSSMSSVNSGLTSYSFLTHGKFSGVITGWIYFLCFVTIPPVESLAVVQYASYYFPILVTKNSLNSNELSIYGYFATCCILFLIIHLNKFGTKLLTKANILTTAWKILIPLIISFALLFNSKINLPEIFQINTFAPYGWQGIMTSLSVGGIIFAFGGFQSGILLAGETLNPKRNIPIATIGAVLLVTFFYTIIQTAFIFAVPQFELSQGWKNLSFYGDLGPFLSLTLAAGLVFLSFLLYLDAIISPFGSALIMSAASSRVMYSLGKTQAAPLFVSHLNKYGSPERSVWICFFVGLILIFPFPGWKEMVRFLTSSYLVALSIAPISLVVLREKFPEAKRKFLLPFYKIISIIAFCVCGLMMHWIGFIVLLQLSIILTSIAFIYALVSYKKSKKTFKQQQFKNASWIGIFIFGFTMINYFSKFHNELNTLSILHSNLIAIVFSICVFFLGCHLSLDKNTVIKNAKSIIH